MDKYTELLDLWARYEEQVEALKVTDAEHPVVAGLRELNNKLLSIIQDIGIGK